MARLKIYDENDNFIGEYIGEFVSDSFDTVADSFEESPLSGLASIVVLLILKCPWLLLVILFWFILKLIWISLKIFLKVAWVIAKPILRTMWWLLGLFCLGIWWLLRLPFVLIFYRELPDWWFPVW